MTDQRLMCVWQAVDLLDQSHSVTSGTARTSTVKDVTSIICRSSRLAHFSNKVFEDNFSNAIVNFSDYVNYIKVCLRDQSVPMAAVEEEFEINSWELCKEYYALHRVTLEEVQVLKLWQIFNKVCIPESMPPVITYCDFQWLGEKFSMAAHQRWSAVLDGPLTFQEFLRELDGCCFKNIIMSEVDKVIGSVHSWLVREICHTGWMQKRTRKQANWTSWHKRWFVLKPGLLSYYTNSLLAEKKGDIILNARSHLEDMECLRPIIGRNYPNRFRISNAPFIEIDLSTENPQSKTEWTSAVTLVIRAAKSGISPSQCKLNDIREEWKRENASSLDTSAAICKENIQRSDGEEDQDSVDGIRSSSISNFSCATIENVEDEGNRSSCEESKVVYCKILAVLDKFIDRANTASGDQHCFTKESFESFLEEIHINLQDTSEVLFDSIKGEGETLLVSSFLDYVIKLLLFQNPPVVASDGKFLSALYSQSCILCKGPREFEDFVEGLWDRQRINYVNKLNEILNKEDSSDPVMILIRQAFSREQSILGTILDLHTEKYIEQLDILYKQIDIGTTDLVQYLKAKWESYPEKLPHDPTRISQDKSLLDIVHYTDETASIPPHNVIDNFQLRPSSTEGKLGVAIFPIDFDSSLMVVSPTQDALLFYGATLSNEEQLKVSLMYHHDLIRFTDRLLCCDTKHVRPSYLYYQNEAILLCPLEEESGVLILGKQDSETKLIVTGFRIPAFTTVYIPRGTIYCVDYTLGIWRRMVNPRAVTQQAQMLQPNENFEPGSSTPKTPSRTTLFGFSFEDQV